MGVSGRKERGDTVDGFSKTKRTGGVRAWITEAAWPFFALRTNHIIVLASYPKLGLGNLRPVGSHEYRKLIWKSTEPAQRRC